jgi:hypothetical protein
MEGKRKTPLWESVNLLLRDICSGNLYVVSGQPNWPDIEA